MKEWLKAKLAALWEKIKALLKSLTAWVQAGALGVWAYILAIWDDPKVLSDSGLTDLVGQISVKKAAYIGLALTVLTVLARLRTAGRK